MGKHYDTTVWVMPSDPVMAACTVPPATTSRYDHPQAAVDAARNFVQQSTDGLPRAEVYRVFRKKNGTIKTAMLFRTWRVPSGEIKEVRQIDKT